MIHKGRPQYGMPLFAERGVSTVDIDSIPALKYPQIDWTEKRPNLTPRVYRWPRLAPRLITHYTKSGWPSKSLRDRVLKAGCHLVPKCPMRYGQSGPKTYLKLAFFEMTSPQAWRISFSLSEKILATSLTFAQRRCFLIVKVCVLFIFNMRFTFREFKSVFFLGAA